METATVIEKENELASSYLSFFLTKEQYAIPVIKVIEILEVPRITKVPKAPEYMIGVINLRGRVLPVVDINLKFGMETQEKTVDTCIVVMNINLAEEEVIYNAYSKPPFKSPDKIA